MTPASAYRREGVLRSGGFDETFRNVRVEDPELYMRLRTFAETMVDPIIAVMHPPRTMRFDEAPRGYVSVWRNYVGLQARHPQRFAASYGQSREGIVLHGWSWRKKARRYLPRTARHLVPAARFAVYVILSCLCVAVSCGHGSWQLR
jgi:hypothetical protein